MRWMVIAGVLVAAAWAMPAQAEDEKATDAATLRAERDAALKENAKLRAIHKNDVDALHEALRRETAQKVKLTVALRTSGEDRDAMLVDLTERLATARAKLAKVEAALTDLAKTLR